MPGRSNRVKPVLRKALNVIKPRNTTNGCAIEEICLSQNPHIQNKLKKVEIFEKHHKEKNRKVKTQKSKVKTQNSKVKTQKSKLKSQKSKVKSQKSKVKSQKSKSKVESRKSKVESQKS